ncbi:MAG TPA: aminotransferase class V-fold PLP-dependent enzyme [Bacteroidia bacterium]|nr:aminotransferase class V-fold PLP-dependent enzyme [Bacteroidia bacterium]
MPVSDQLKAEFLLDPSVVFLNFGSFGATPRNVFETYQTYQLELEREPVRFIAANGPAYLKKSRAALANYIHCEADDLVYVPNPSYAINVIAKSLNLQPGDEVLSTALEYGALDRTWNYYCKQKGARYVRQEITLPLVSKEVFLADFFKGLTPQTKAIFISQIASTTGLIFPVKEICEKAKQKGLITIVDGAHVPGHIPLDLGELQADIYTGACHKWMMTPKGCSFLFVRKEFQPFDPLVVSWGYEALFPSASHFIDYHQMQGTRDFSAFLTVQAAIDFMKKHHWEAVSASCRRLAHSNYQRFCDLLGTVPLCPIGDEFLGQMCSISIRTPNPEALHQHLFDQYRIEIPVMRQEERTYIRYSIQAFNTQADLDKLYEALQEIISQGKHIAV